jgi:methylene-fatty-acyl-phospholipid synthase
VTGGGGFLLAAILLSLERVCYIWIWRKPESFVTVCRRRLLTGLGGPVSVLRLMFYLFKAIQIGVFGWWCYSYGNGAILPPTATGSWVVLGLMLISVGQLLNLSVFHRLGPAGVFYGNRFGYEVPWRTGFPFSMMNHPQYVGTVLTIWGAFLILRFPHPDWYALPALETAYYVIGARFEH